MRRSASRRRGRTKLGRKPCAPHGHKGAAFASIYAGSKHAVEGITRSVALEVAKLGIRVNAVAPGPSTIPMHFRVMR